MAKEVIFRVFLDGKEITTVEAMRLEKAGTHKVSRGASAAVPAEFGGGNEAWIEMEAVTP